MGLLVHKVMKASEEQGFREGRLLLQDRCLRPTVPPPLTPVPKPTSAARPSPSTNGLRCVPSSKPGTTRQTAAR